MKRCPECRRDYYDDSLAYCLDDGTVLVDGPASMDEPATAILSEPAVSAGGLARPLGQSETNTAIFQTPATAAGSDRAAGFDKRLVAAPLLVLIIVFGAYFGYRYFVSASSKQIDSIAVMPFVNESGDPQAEYLSDGMTDTLISSLSELPNIKVKARTSVFRYKGKEIDPKAVGRELGVQAIVNGRVAQRDGRTNVSLEVVDTDTEDVILSRKYDKPQSELATLQSEIAHDVSGRLKSKLSGAEEAKVTKTYTADPEALQLYLKGQFYWHKRGRDNLLQAADFFNKAIEKDPNYALAYAGLSLTYVVYSGFDVASPAESYPKAKAAAMRALELDESLAEPHAALGLYYIRWEWDYARAEKEFRRAIELNPNYATAHQWFSANVLLSQKRFDEAMAEGKRAQELDPLSAVITSDLGFVYLFARHYDEAVEMYRLAQEIDPAWVGSHMGFGMALSTKGHHSEAIISLRKAVELSNGAPRPKSGLAYVLAKAGQRDEALKLVEEIERQASHDFVRSDTLVYPYIALGNKDEAFVQLEKAVDEHDNEATLLSADPFLDDLRSEPRFRALLKRINLPE